MARIRRNLTYSFNVAADDSTLIKISSDETVKFIGASGVSTTADNEGNITISGGGVSESEAIALAIALG